MVIEATEIKLWKSGTFVSAVSMPTIEWLSQLIGCLLRRLIQKEKKRASGPMRGAILAKVAIVTQFPYKALLIGERTARLLDAESHWVSPIFITGSHTGHTRCCPR
jgi:hypothetical protein